MKVLFLDIDGVLNNGTALQHDGIDAIDPSNVAHLVRIESDTGCYIVVSSTWRLMPSAMNTLRVKLLNFGAYDVVDKMIGVTPDQGKTRGEEIENYLSNRPGIKKFVILDDDDDMGRLLPHLVRTTFTKGLTREEADEVVRRLNDPEN